MRRRFEPCRGRQKLLRVQALRFPADLTPIVCGFFVIEEHRERAPGMRVDERRAERSRAAPRGIFCFRSEGDFQGPCLRMCEGTAAMTRGTPRSGPPAEISLAAATEEVAPVRARSGPENVGERTEARISR